MTKYEAEVTKREVEGVYNLRHFFAKLQTKAVNITFIFLLLFALGFYNVFLCDSVVILMLYLHRRSTSMQAVISTSFQCQSVCRAGLTFDSEKLG